MNDLKDWTEEELLIFLQESESKGKRILNALTNHLSAAFKVRTELSNRIKCSNQQDTSLMYGSQPVTITTVGISYRDRVGSNQNLNIDVARNIVLPIINSSTKTETTVQQIRDQIKI